jgi:hypothetical protein
MGAAREKLKVDHAELENRGLCGYCKSRHGLDFTLAIELGRLACASSISASSSFRNAF